MQKQFHPLSLFHALQFVWIEGTKRPRSEYEVRSEGQVEKEWEWIEQKIQWNRVVKSVISFI